MTNIIFTHYRYILILIFAVMSTISVAANIENQSLAEKPKNIPMKISKYPLPWSQLNYKASKLGLSVKSQVMLVNMPKEKINLMLIEPEQGTAIISHSDNNYYMTLHTKLLGRDLRTMLWFDPAQFQALQRASLETGVKRHQYKVYRFTDDGVFTVKTKPKNAEHDLPYEKWTDIATEYLKLPLKRSHNLKLTTPVSLFYIVSIADLNQIGDSIDIPMLYRGRVLIVKLSVESQQRYIANYIKKLPTETTQINKYVDALEISIQTRSVKNEDENYDFKLAGLKGNLRFLIDLNTRIPLELSGEIKYIGTVRFKLERVEHLVKEN